MKNYLIAITLLSCALAFTACGNSNDSSQGQTETSVSEKEETSSISDDYDKQVEIAYQWLKSENFLGDSNISLGEDVKSSEAKEIKKQVTEDAFGEAWKKAIAEEIGDNTWPMSIQTRMDLAIEVYNAVWGNTEKVQSAADLVNDMVDAKNEQISLNRKYPFYMSADTEIIEGNTYVIERLNESYTDNIVGMLQKEIDSYTPTDDSSWLCIDLDKALFGGNDVSDYYVIHSTEKNPFTSEGEYYLAVVNPGNTIELTNDKGFQSTVSVLELISDKEQYCEDLALYQSDEERINTDLDQLYYFLGSTSGDSESLVSDTYNDTADIFVGKWIDKDGFDEIEITKEGDTFCFNGTGAVQRTSWTYNGTAELDSDGVLIFSDEKYETYHPEEGITQYTCSGSIYIGSDYMPNEELKVYAKEWSGESASDGVYLILKEDSMQEITSSSEETTEYIVNNSDSERYIWPESMDDPGSYMCSWSSDELITESEMAELDYYSARIVKNEIYARHGRKFKDQELQEHFDSKNWYNGIIEPDDFNEEDVLNEVEKQNIKILNSFMEKHAS